MRENYEGLQFANAGDEDTFLRYERAKCADLLALFDSISELLAYIAPVSSERAIIRTKLRDQLLRIVPDEAGS